MHRPALIPGLLVSILLIFAGTGSAAQRTAAGLQALQQNRKINMSPNALDRLWSDTAAQRVIVTLRDPQVQNGAMAGRAADAAFKGSRRGLRQVSVRRQLTTEVRSMQRRVIETHALDAARIKKRFDYVFGFSAQLTAEEVQALAQSPDVVAIEEDRRIEAQLAQGLPLMNASIISDTHSGAGMAIAICDTGIDYTHPMLGGGEFPNAKVIGGYDIGENDADPMDGNGHGTACAGIAAGALATDGDYVGGVAYSAKLYAFKISDSPTSGSARASDMVAAWELCITHQYDDPANPIMVISTSFGGGKFTNQADCDASLSAMTIAAANAKAAGITILVSAGNNGYCDALAWPACLSDVISVGAVYDAAFGDYRPCISADSCVTKIAEAACATGYYAIDSTAADRVTAYSNTADFLTLLAPSNAARTTALGGGYWDATSGFGGTSAACPYAAGAAACLQSAAKARTGAFLTPEEVKDYLTRNGDLITDGKVAIAKPRIDLGRATDALPSEPMLATEAARAVTADSAISGGTVVDDGAEAITVRGVCWSLSPEPTLADHCTSDGSGAGAFSSVLNGLEPEAVYHVRAYGTNRIGTGYGENQTFTTLPVVVEVPVSSGGGGGGGCFIASFMD